MVHSVPNTSLRLAAVQHAASQSEERTIDMEASPQCENGYTRLANEIIEALMKSNLSAYQSRILWAVWRETYGSRGGHP